MKFGGFQTAREAALRADARPRFESHADVRQLAASTLRLLGQMTGRTTVAEPRSGVSSAPSPRFDPAPEDLPVETVRADRKLAADSSLDPTAATIGSAAASSARAGNPAQDWPAQESRPSTLGQDFSAAAPAGDSSLGINDNPWFSTSTGAGETSAGLFAQRDLIPSTNEQSAALWNSPGPQVAPAAQSSAGFSAWGPRSSSSGAASDFASPGNEPAPSSGSPAGHASAAKPVKADSITIRQLLPSIEAAVDERAKALESSLQARLSALREEMRNYQSMRAALYR